MRSAGRLAAAAIVLVTATAAVARARPGTPRPDPEAPSRITEQAFGSADDSRVPINFDHTIRSSIVPSREYERNRVLATVTYGF